MRKSDSPTTRFRPLRAGLASGAAIVAVLAATAAPAMAEAKLTLSPTTGPSAGGNTIIGQAPSGITPFLASTPPIAEFQAITASVTSCNTYYRAPAAVAGTAGNLTAGAVAVTTVIRINSARVAVTVPTGVVLPTNFTTARFNLCFYDSDSQTASTLLASAPYSVSVKPTITNISPTAGPALGGYQVNVTGTGFTANTTATLGNVPLTNIVVNAAGTLLTATAPPRTAGTGVQLVITTAGGTVSSNDPDNNGFIGVGSSDSASTALNFSLTNGIVVTPNTAPSGTTPSLDINGVGFSGMTLSDTATALSALGGGSVDAGYAAASVTATGHIVLVARSAGYSAAATTTVATATAAQLATYGGRPVTLCMNPLVLSDTELLCTLDLADSLSPIAADTAGSTTNVPTGSYNVQIIRDGAPGATTTVDATAITSGSTFTVSDY